VPTFLTRARASEHIAAIDLGSNAMRAIIVRKTPSGLDVVKNVREPLRLGEDVFSKGKITPDKMLLTEEAFINLLHLFTEYNVKNIKAVATSAMRDAKNGKELHARILESTGIDIQTISGKLEAGIIFDAP
jgi:exopolyphosphatase/guanosine-5'-triphosphate,3'-diphosphate pyrophosphatase